MRRKECKNYQESFIINVRCVCKCVFADPAEKLQRLLDVVTEESGKLYLRTTLIKNFSSVSSKKAQKCDLTVNGNHIQ